MFSVREKRMISDKIQKILRETNHPELPKGEIYFKIHVEGESGWSWADIENNGAVENPSINIHNEKQDPLYEAVQKIKTEKELVQDIFGQRAHILEAFIAETGFLPSECEQVYENGNWYVRKKQN